YNFYSDAVSHFKREDYTKALSLSIKAERLLDSGTLTLIAEEKHPRAGEEVVEVLVCPGCDSEIAEDDAFCRECGQNLAIAQECPGCGAEFTSADKFCRKCGHKLR
ncbi:MAG: zinc ribbon domain-containing protein, partial [Thermoplasmata archaeon]